MNNAKYYTLNKTQRKEGGNLKQNFQETKIVKMIQVTDPGEKNNVWINYKPVKSIENN